MAISQISRALYRVGVDVGGTNTDAVLVQIKNDEMNPDAPDRVVKASFKTETTSDITSGIACAVKNVIASVPHGNILSVNIGTTHFINAVVTADSTKLNPVAVLRLCGPFTREIPPFTDFPPRLRTILTGYIGYLQGGVEIDGRVIDDIDEQEVREHAEKIKSAGIRAITIVGVFSPLDSASTSQEAQVQKIIRDIIPDADIVCSRDIGRAGILERENASILNASIMEIGRQIIQGFEDAVLSMNLTCPLYLTQNDGTLMDAASACKTPIKTFSSGATNSLTGAIFLSGIHSKDSGLDLSSCQVIMVDIGGTTTDIAALSPSGFPRQSPATVDIGGVRTAFSIPDVLSIGLGGGSHVSRNDKGQVTVGPESVGYELSSASKCFGGDKLTATDIAVQSGGVPSITPQWKEPIQKDIVLAARKSIVYQLQRAVDMMKSSEQQVVLLLVGGGSVIMVDDLQGVIKCIRPQNFSVANAVGAAISKVSGEIDRIEHLKERTRKDLQQALEKEAVLLACQHGADQRSVKIVEFDMIPLQDMGSGVMRVIVKAVGELGLHGSFEMTTKLSNKSISKAERCTPTDIQEVNPAFFSQLEDVETYEPQVVKETGEWIVSETDVAYISEGCGILGTGGGGATYYGKLSTTEVLRSLGEKKVRILAASSFADTDQIATLAWVGAPAVSNERLPAGQELDFATLSLVKHLGLSKLDGLMTGEIGGWNGFCTFGVAARLGIPVIDSDTVGRAVPQAELCLPFVYGKSKPWPAAISDARDNVQLILSAQSPAKFEGMLRTASVELGSCVGMCLPPMPVKTVKECCPLGSISFAWFLGREIFLARKRNTDVAQSLVTMIPGGMLLYSGKITSVMRDVRPGWTVGTCTIMAIDEEDGTSSASSRSMSLQYQNEYLHASLVNSDESLDVVATVPDLITVLDQTGSALATHDIRYGLRVSVIAFPANPLWKTEVALRAGGPQHLGLDMKYKEFGVSWAEPPSVFKQFAR